MNDRTYKKTLKLRTVGFLASVVLTLVAYLIFIRPEFFGIKTALILVFIFAVVQLIVQFLFFLNIWREKGTVWNVGIFVSTLAILVIIIAFSIWIMNHLNYNMMPQ